MFTAISAQTIRMMSAMMIGATMDSGCKKIYVLQRVLKHLHR